MESDQDEDDRSSDNFESVSSFDDHREPEKELINKLEEDDENESNKKDEFMKYLKQSLDKSRKKKILHIMNGKKSKTTNITGTQSKKNYHNKRPKNSKSITDPEIRKLIGKLNDVWGE